MALFAGGAGWEDCGWCGGHGFVEEGGKGEKRVSEMGIKMWVEVRIGE